MVGKRHYSRSEYGEDLLPLGTDGSVMIMVGSMLQVLYLDR